LNPITRFCTQSALRSTEHRAVNGRSSNSAAKPRASPRRITCDRQRRKRQCSTESAADLTSPGRNRMLLLCDFEISACPVAACLKRIAT
jgi:hypothetical protein